MDIRDVVAGSGRVGPVVLYTKVAVAGGPMTSVNIMEYLSRRIHTGDRARRNCVNSTLSDGKSLFVNCQLRHGHWLRDN
jgi:hypothetical protein